MQFLVNKIVTLIDGIPLSNVLVQLWQSNRSSCPCVITGPSLAPVVVVSTSMFGFTIVLPKFIARAKKNPGLLQGNLIQEWMPIIPIS